MKVDRDYLAALTSAQRMDLMARCLNENGRSMATLTDSLDQLNSSILRLSSSYQAALTPAKVDEAR